MTTHQAAPNLVFLAIEKGFLAIAINEPAVDKLLELFENGQATHSTPQQRKDVREYYGLTPLEVLTITPEVFCGLLPSGTFTVNVHHQDNQRHDSNDDHPRGSGYDPNIHE